MQAVGYIVRALLLAAGHALPPTLLEAGSPLTTSRSQKSHRVKLRSHWHAPSARESLAIESQHAAFAASAGGNSQEATTHITQLSICENEIGAQGVQELMLLFHPSYGEPPCLVKG